MHRMLICLLAAILCFSGCAAPPPTDNNTPPAPTDTEWRAVWVSFLELDTLLTDTNAETAAARLDEMMDTCRARDINTVLFHVRAHSDAYYVSEAFPPATAAASLLAQGFDPLAYAIEAAHSRGLALHAWVNPYRIDETPQNAVTEAVFQQGDTYYYNPADDGVKRAVLAGIRELLAYPVDGIHFDDYFYPAGLTDTAATFENVPPDTDVGDWRRTQVDTLVSAVHGLCRRTGKVFGISPVGVVEKARQNQYADVARWMASDGYIDYICPQLYYGFQHETYPYKRVLADWAALPRADGVALYIGLALYKQGLTDDRYAGTGRQEWVQNSDIIERQIAALRATDRVDGFALFRYDYLVN